MITQSLVVLLAASLASTTLAQLTPDRLYYGVDRPIPMTIKVPEGKTGEVKIELLEAVTANSLSSASAAAGSVNLATIFPEIWGKKDSKIVYAQLVVGDEKIGSAVVIQPMVDRGVATTDPQTKKAIFNPTPKAYSGVRAWSDRNILIETTKGSMTFELRADQAPNTSFNFIHLCEGGFYTDIAFHRILGTKQFPFVVQVGDPTGLGSGGPGYAIDLEDSKLLHDFGVLSMARTPDPNSNGSQVFICLSRERCASLDTQYTAFGQLIAGADTLAALAETPVGPSDKEKQAGRPIDAPKIIRAKLVEAAPYRTGAKPASTLPVPPVTR